MDVYVAFSNFPLSVKIKNSGRYKDLVTPVQFSSCDVKEALL